MQQRYYDPIAGRFLSVDPVTTDAATGSGFNRYVYGNNNPYKFKDPDGRQPVPGFLPPPPPAALGGFVSSGQGALGTPPRTAAQIDLGIPGQPTLSQQISTKLDGFAAALTSFKDTIIKGVIYLVDGDKTPSGKPYVGRTEDLDKRAATANDGRDRTGAKVIGTYPNGDVAAGRVAEQKAMNDQGGVNNLDNKRNEIDPKHWTERGIDPK